MIIAIATDDGTNLAEHPDGCGGFVVFEIEHSTAVRVGYRTNPCVPNGAEYGIGERPSRSRGDACQTLVAALSDCGALVSRNIDDELVRELRGGMIDAYVCRERSVDGAARLFAQGDLQKTKGGKCRAGG